MMPAPSLRRRISATRQRGVSLLEFSVVLLIAAFAFGAIAFYGLMLGGWASSSKYSFLGAMRSAAQLISYELAAGLSLAFTIYVLYQTFSTEAISRGTGWLLLAMLGPIYVAGVYCFAHGWERGDVGKAVRLTAIVVAVTLAFVIVLAILFVIFAASSKKSGSSSSSSSSDSDSGGGGSAEPSSGGVASLASSGGGGGSDYSGRDLLLDTMVLTAGVGQRREEAAALNQEATAPGGGEGSAVCAKCQGRFEPAEGTQFCPRCGAPLNG